MKKRASGLAIMWVVLYFAFIIGDIIWIICDIKSKYYDELIQLIGSGVLLGIIGGVIIFAYYRTSVRNLAVKTAFETSPNLEVSAKVVAKASQVVGDSFSTGTVYFISFEFPDGCRRNFTVNVAQYNAILENETGILTYRQKDNLFFFVDFRHQA